MFKRALTHLRDICQLSHIQRDRHAFRLHKSFTACVDCHIQWISTFIRGFVSVIVDSAVVQIAIMLSSWSCSPVPNQFYFHPNPPFTSCISGNITACPIFLGTRMELITENPHSWPYEGQSGVRNVCAWQWSDAAAYFGLPQDLMGQFVSSSQASACDRCECAADLVITSVHSICCSRLWKCHNDTRF